MTKYKEFQGKSLDDAIRDACDYYGVPREKLEIEIVSDAKSGIFGLVGAKKATIRAARVTLAETVSSLVGAAERGATAPGKEADAPQKDAPPKNPAPEARRAPRPQTPKAGPAPARQRGAGASDAPAVDPAPSSPPSAAGPDATQAEASPAPTSTAEKDRRSRGRHALERPPAEQPGKDRHAPERRPRESADDKRPSPVPPPEPARFPAAEETFTTEEADDLALEAVREDMPEFDLAGADHAALALAIESVVLRLVEPIVGRVPCRVDIGKDRARIFLDCGDAAGLLVGREGQTLASVQYLAARIIARKIGGALRLHIDAGNYRERQDDRLKEVALSLAARVKKTHKPQATRPLSAYQRRIVHLALEHDPEVTTRSKGEGAQRRVVVYWNKDAANKAGS
jgi:spoIIIJ-associated protein